MFLYVKLPFRGSMCSGAFLELLLARIFRNFLGPVGVPKTVVFIYVSLCKAAVSGLEVLRSISRNVLYSKKYAENGKGNLGGWG